MNNTLSRVNSIWTICTTYMDYKQHTIVDVQMMNMLVYGETSPGLHLPHTWTINTILHGYPDDEHASPW